MLIGQTLLSRYKITEKIGWIKDGKLLDYEDIFKFINFNNARLGRLPLGRRLKDDQFPTETFIGKSQELQ